MQISISMPYHEALMKITCVCLLFGWGFLLSWKKLCFIKSVFGRRWKKYSTLLVLEELITISYIYGRAVYYELIWERWAIAMIIGENPIPAIYFCCPPPLPPVPINYLSFIWSKCQVSIAPRHCESKDIVPSGFAVLQGKEHWSVSVLYRFSF